MMKKIILPLVAVFILAGMVYIGTNNLPKQESPTADNNTQAPLVEDPSEAGLPEDSGAPEAIGEPALPEGIDEEPLTLGEAPTGIEEPISQEPTVPAWQLPDAPTQSPPLEKGEQPKNAIKISMSASGISPSPLEVKRGEQLTFSVSSVDDITHVFRFKDPILAAVVVGLGRGQTRAITFYAPSTKGDYEFYCAVPGHEARGEKGIMTVK